MYGGISNTASQQKLTQNKLRNAHDKWNVGNKGEKDENRVDNQLSWDVIDCLEEVYWDDT